MQKNNTKNTKIIRNFAIFFAITMFFACFLSQNFANVFAENVFEEKVNFQTSAKSAVLLDSKSKRVLFEKNMNEMLPMASTTKIVTAITVIENCDDLNKVVTIKKEGVGIFGTSIYLREGEQLSIRELLFGLMLRSGNDAAVTLALEVGGTIENFCNMMNNLAKKVGASNSNFKNPHGLDEKGHHTTAHDLALITSYALENEDFLNIVKTPHIKICEGTESERYLVNKNKLLTKLDGCIGVKTGFTDDAGRCLVSACERDGLRLVCVVFNCGPMFEDSEKLLNLGFEKFKLVEILPAYFYVKDLVVLDGNVEKVGLCTKKGFSCVLSEQELSNLNVVFSCPDEIRAPIKKDEEVGVCEIYYRNHLIFSEKIYTIEEAYSVLYKDKIKEILKGWNA